MIEISTSTDALQNTGENPYIEEPADQQANPLEYGNPYDDMISAQREMIALLRRLVNTADAQRNTPRETMLQLSTTPFNTTLQYRVQEIILTTDGATTIGLVIGTSTQQRFNFATAETRRLPYITVIGRGIDIALSATGGATVSGYIIAYPE